MPVAIGQLVLQIAQAMAVAPGLRGVIVLEGLAQPMPVVRPPVSTLGPVRHDDVRVIVQLLPGGTVRVRDDLHQAVDMRIIAEVMAVEVLVIVRVRHRPMLPVAVRCGQTVAGQEQPHHAGRRGDQEGPRLSDRFIQRAGLYHRRLQPIEQQP